VQQITIADGPEPDLLRGALSASGYVCIRGLEDESALLAWAESMGEIVAPGVGMPDGMHDGRIYSVAVRGGGKGEVDRYGHSILSTTDRAFPLHTDAYNRPEAPRYVFLLRSDRGTGSTASQVSDAREAIGRLSAEHQSLLREAIFPSAIGPRPLLEPANGTTLFRFNGEEIRRWADREGDGLSAGAAAAMAALEEELTAIQETFTIDPLVCLLVDNWRVCHGRSRIPAGSERVLKRVWVA
jgi:alpha-ketoglutarate-dependent taurine dioxygenase